jgi:hypothetical protein
MTVQDLRPNSQDASAFYLGNIYGVLADPNASIPSPIVKPPPFSPPRYAVWVNSLWFLSLVMSLSCALWATSLHQWARRYIRVTQPARCSPEKRARIRAFFADGVDKMHMPWAVEGLPALLHLSLFLFFGGLVIFLFNVDREVFLCVVSWIGLFSMAYGLITLLPLIRQDSPYYSPLSILAWFSYASIRYVTSKVLLSIDCYDNFETWERSYNMRGRYRGWMSGGVEKKGEEMASEQSSKIDVGILGWTISALGDDDSLEKFIETAPGFFNSKLVKDLREHLPDDLWRRFLDATNGFLGRTLSSNLVIDSVKLHRLDMSLSAINLINVRVSGVTSILKNICLNHWDQVPKTIEIKHTLERWCTSNDRPTALFAQGILAKVLWTVPERDDRWVELATRVYSLPERELRDILTHDHDSGSLAILIHLTRKSFRSDLLWDVLEAFTQIDIRKTLSGLQHDFCTLWNEIVQEAKNRRAYSIPIYTLREIRHHYIALHEGTDAAPTLFTPSTGPLDRILFYPSSYPLCDIVSHRPDYVPLPFPTEPAHSPNASPHSSISGGSTISRQVNEATIIARPPSPSLSTIPSEVGDSSQTPAATSPALLVHTSPRPADVSPPGAVAAALQDIPPAATLSHPLEGPAQRDIVALCIEPDITEVLSTASLPAPTPTLVSVPLSTPPVLNKSLESCDAGAASTSNPLLPAFSIPASPPPSRIPPLPDAESLALLRSTTPSRSTVNATLPRLRARGLVNTGSMCFANAVLQLLVHSPPFWDIFRELGDLKGLRGEGVSETSDGATPLVDATLRFFEEFVFKGEPPPAQQPPQQVAGGIPREDEDATKEHDAVDSFEPTYIYDSMKEKWQFKAFLVCFAS